MGNHGILQPLAIFVSQERLPSNMVNEMAKAWQSSVEFYPIC